MRVLLVEDDERIALFVVKGLREAGFAVDHAANGEDGLHLALTEPYDIVIVDLMLPKIDGLTLILKVRENKPTIPVMILSAKRSVDDRVKGLQTGSDDYLTKPFAFSELLARVNALIRRSTGASSPTKMEWQTCTWICCREKSSGRDRRSISSPGNLFSSNIL